MTGAIAVFVKTPGLSPVKTRLAASIGPEAAERWHRRSAACVGRVAAASGLPVYWAVAERDAMEHPLWRGRPRLFQGDGGLGSRMATIHADLVARHGAGMLLGADLPQLDAGELSAAGSWLAHAAARRVIGPARDGGFWLFGANRAVEHGAWESVAYGRDDTLRSFVAAVAGGRWRRLSTRTDLDRFDDIAQVLTELRALPDPLPEQRELADRLERLLADGRGSNRRNRVRS